MKEYKIYTLNDPLTNEVKYVGRTTQKLSDRLRKHINIIYEEKGDTKRKNWILELSINNLIPTINLIDIAYSKEDANLLEIKHISFYKEKGFVLLNMTIGGSGSYGYKHSEETLNKLKGKTFSNDVKNNMSKSQKERWENKTDEEKLDNIISQKNRKTILQFDLQNNLINEFLSLRQIERELGYFRANIVPCIKGKFQQAYGYIWKYKDNLVDNNL
jgi:hypothetical protein